MLAFLAHADLAKFEEWLLEGARQTRNLEANKAYLDETF